MIQVSRESILSFVGSLNDIIDSGEGDEYIDRFYDNLLEENPHLLDLVTAEAEEIIKGRNGEEKAESFLKGFMFCYSALSRAMDEIEYEDK